VLEHQTSTTLSQCLGDQDCVCWFAGPQTNSHAAQQASQTSEDDASEDDQDATSEDEVQSSRY